MPNIKFNYLYRDSANYKTFGYVIFANPDNMDIAELDTLVRSKLIDGMFFYTTPWQLPKLFPDPFDPCRAAGNAQMNNHSMAAIQLSRTPSTPTPALPELADVACTVERETKLLTAGILCSRWHVLNGLDF